MGNSKEKLSASIEDYLETIYILEQKNKAVRVKDISRELEVSMPSVHQALHVLEDSGLIVHENYGYIELTRIGQKRGKDIYKKHKVLMKFLREILGVSLEVAENDACLLEHYVSRETLSRLSDYIEKLGKKENG